MKTGLGLTLLTLASLGTLALPAYGSSELDRDVLDEVNYLRANPGDYADELDALQQHFDGRILYGNGEEPDMTTNEGARAVDEAARDLRRISPLPEIKHSDILAQAAADHVASQGATGQVGHVSNGRRPGQRVKARGGNIYVGEVIAYGIFGARNAVRQLVVDDGVPGRGHRKLLLFAPYRYAGVACGPHKKWRNMCVVVLSETRDGSPVMSVGN